MATVFCPKCDKAINTARFKDGNITCPKCSHEFREGDAEQDRGNPNQTKQGLDEMEDKARGNLP